MFRAPGRVMCSAPNKHVVLYDYGGGESLVLAEQFIRKHKTLQWRMQNAYHKDVVRLFDHEGVDLFLSR